VRPAESASLVYVYCLVQSASAPRMGAARGLPDGKPPRPVSLGRGRWLVVADVPGRDFSETGLAARIKDLDWVGECAVAHNALVMQTMKKGPVVPMRLFTIFEDESRARDSALKASRRIGHTLRRVAGRAEFGVRIGANPAARPKLVPPPRQVVTGRSFLEHKREQLAARRAGSPVPADERDRAFSRLAALAVDARERSIPVSGSAIWLDGAFLVPIASASVFKSEVQRMARELRPRGHDVTLTGPWPPYSFLDESNATIES
jgi:hypothetical protein